MIELVLVKVKATHQRADGAVARIERNKCAFHFGQLGNLPGVFWRFHHANYRPSANLDVGRCLVAQTRLRRFETFARDLECIPIGASGHNFARGGLQHHRRQHIAIVRVVGQRIVNGVFHFLRLRRRRQRYKLLGPPVLLAPLVIHDALAQREIGGILLGGIQRGVNIQPARVSLVAVLRKNQLPGHLGNVLRMNPR